MCVKKRQKNPTHIKFLKSWDKVWQKNLGLIIKRSVLAVVSLRVVKRNTMEVAANGLRTVAGWFRAVTHVSMQSQVLKLLTRL